MSVKTIFLRTDGTGAYTYQRNFKARINAIEYVNVDLSTPDIDITDDTYGTSFLSVNGVAADSVYFPGNFLQSDAGTDLEVDTGVKAAAPAVCMGVLKVVISGGGDTKRGKLYIHYDL